jgi:hypothetical protein
MNTDPKHWKEQEFSGIYLTKYELMSAVGSLKEAGLFCCWLLKLPIVLLALKSR